MADDPFILACDKRKSQTFRNAQGLHDLRFIAAAVFSFKECCGYEAGDFLLIRSRLASYLHSSRMPSSSNVRNRWKADIWHVDSRLAEPQVTDAIGRLSCCIQGQTDGA